MGQRLVVVGDGVDVKEDGPRDVRLLELGPGIALELRHVPAAVDDTEIRIVEVRGEPLGPDDGVVHGRMILPATVQGAGGVG
jgi:hypothetical protein